MSKRTIELEILRYDPDNGAAPTFSTYSVPCDEDWVVLDALNYVKDHLDRTLSYRWSCHMAVCGSCGMMVNGEPTLSCKASSRTFPIGSASSRWPISRSSATW
jgi:fumarate reductase iron-sulfur subunit